MDTKKITNAILVTGLTQQELADLVPCAQSTIAAFVNGTRGTNPTYVIATRLLEIHAERCLPPGPAPNIPRRSTDPEPLSAPERPFRRPPNAKNVMELCNVDALPNYASVPVASKASASPPPTRPE